MSIKLVVVGSDDCVWCDRLRTMLDKHMLDYSYIYTDESIKMFLLANGLQTVPQTFLNGKLLGGYENVRLLLEGDNNATAD